MEDQDLVEAWLGMVGTVDEVEEVTMVTQVEEVEQGMLDVVEWCLLVGEEVTLVSMVWQVVEVTVDMVVGIIMELLDSGDSKF